MALHIAKWVKGWRLDKFFASLGNSKTRTQAINDIAAKSVFLVNKAKELSNNPTIDMVTAQIPGDWDDKIVAKVRAFLPKVLATVDIQGTVANPDEIERGNVWRSLFARIAGFLNEGQFDLNHIIITGLGMYSDLKGKE
jgi:hypothetical protein